MASFCVNYGAASKIRSAWYEHVFVLFLYFSYGVNFSLSTSFFSVKLVINSRLTAFFQLQRMSNLEGYRRQLWRCSWLAHCTQFNSRSQWWLSWRGVLLISLILSAVIFFTRYLWRVRLGHSTRECMSNFVLSFRVRTETYWWAGDSVINDSVLIKAHNSHKYNFGLINYVHYYVHILPRDTPYTLIPSMVLSTKISNRVFFFLIFILSPCILETRCYELRLVHYEL
jgi:hypothetical protein